MIVDAEVKALLEQSATALRSMLTAVSPEPELTLIENMMYLKVVAMPRAEAAVKAIEEFMK